VSLAKTFSVGLYGLSGTVIEVETDISSQLPSFTLVGLPDASLSEATARVRAACTNSGFGFPSKKVVVNLSPAAVPKSGSAFDLAIAVSVLAAMEVVPKAALDGLCLIGELGLDGTLRQVPGVLPMVLHARRSGFGTVVCPVGNLSEAGMVDDIEVLGAATLAALVRWLKGEGQLAETCLTDASAAVDSTGHLDLSQVIGQSQAVEGLIVAAAGGHHLAMVGAPGAGKTMLAERIPGILPSLTTDQALEVAAIESIAGNGQAALTLDTKPRFQAPHHSSSTAALIGGGNGIPRPGAVSKAHHGVLFLDEALEFQGHSLDSLREPLESGRVLINRSGGSAVFPAKFQLVLAANPCPCGLSGLTNRECTCSAMAVRRYTNRLSGPVLDRIDIRLAIKPVSLGANLGLFDVGPSSAEALARVVSARAAAQERLSTLGYRLNSEVPGPVLRGKLGIGAKALKDLDRMLMAGKTSMRGYDRCLRLAWTISDLEGLRQPGSDQVRIAVSLRGSDNLLGA
jgi:magnesium chelatase family protein